MKPTPIALGVATLCGYVRPVAQFSVATYIAAGGKFSRHLLTGGKA